jgi:hypothetical protein
MFVLSPSLMCRQMLFYSLHCHTQSCRTRVMFFPSPSP